MISPKYTKNSRNEALYSINNTLFKTKQLFVTL